MKKIAILALVSPLLVLTGCGGADAPAESDNTVGSEAAESEFDQQLSDADANAALDALDAEDAAAVED